MVNSEENITNKDEETAQNAADNSTAEQNAGGAADGAENDSTAEGGAAEAKAEADADDAAASSSEKADGTNASGGAAASKEEKKERKFFKKKKDKKDEKIEELNDKLMRQMAEFDNYRKRTEKEKMANYVIGAKDVIEKLLPVVDNFERGLANADASDPFVDGMNKVYKQLMTIFADLGVKPIEAVGQEFDPNLHNAVMHIDDEELGENIIAEEFQKGYLYKEQVVRHSMVKVAN